MARGITTKVLKRDAAAISKAIYKAEKDVDEKKSFMLSLREHIGRMIDRINPTETLAIVAGTILVKSFIDSHKDISDRIANMQLKGVEEYWKTLIASNPSQSVEMLELYNKLLAGYGFETKTMEQMTDENSSGNIKTAPTPDIMTWSISYLVAYFIIAKGADMSKGLSSFVGWFLP